MRIFELKDLFGQNIAVVLEMFLHINWRHIGSTLVTGAWGPTDLKMVLDHVLGQCSQGWGWDVATLGALCSEQGVRGQHPRTQDIQRRFAQLIEFNGSCRQC